MEQSEGYLPPEATEFTAPNPLETFFKEKIGLFDRFADQAQERLALQTSRRKLMLTGLRFGAAQATRMAVGSGSTPESSR